MAVTRFHALRVADYAKWQKTVRAALYEAGSVPGAAALLTEQGYPCDKYLLFVALRNFPDVIDEPLKLILPKPRGLPRGSPRQDKVPGWTPSPETVQRQARRRKLTEKEP